MGFMATRKELAVSLYSNDEERWAAVVRRDRGAEGVFYYSVRTTGVYCRPSCAARLARRENVRFHSSCEEAEAAGFRPCKRCRPNEAGLNEQRAAIVDGRGDAQSRIARRIRRHEPLSFSSRLQVRHRRHAESLRGGPSRAANA